MGLDQYASFVLWAFGITWLVFGVYLLYLRSRLGGLRRQLDRLTATGEERRSAEDSPTRA